MSAQKSNPWGTAGENKKRYTITVDDHTAHMIKELQEEYGIRSESAAAKMALEDYLRGRNQKQKENEE